jgi:hypothetical protein
MAVETISIEFVNAAPTPPAANTIYFIKGATEDDFQIMATNSDATVVRQTAAKSTIDTDLANNVNGLGGTFGPLLDEVGSRPGSISQTLWDYAQQTRGLANSNSGQINGMGQQMDANSASIASLQNAFNTQNSAVVVGDITARDALTLAGSRFVLVTDATDDTTVNSGSAMYFYDKPNDTWEKIYEAEGMDLNIVHNWADIQNKPASSVVDIDAAVTNTHVHSAEMETFEAGLLFNGDVPEYNGNPLTTTANSEW